MASLKKRLDKLDGGGECPECKMGPGTPIKVNIRRPQMDEDGRWHPAPPSPPRYCPACGRTLPTIRMRGLDEKSSGALA